MEEFCWFTAHDLLISVGLKLENTARIPHT